jgi:hypothetical protein
MSSLPTVDVRLLRMSAPMREDVDILGWLDLHQRLCESPEGTLALTQRDLASQWRRPETSVRRFLSRLATAGWISLETGRQGASISMGRPPVFVSSVETCSSLSLPSPLPSSLPEEPATSVPASSVVESPAPVDTASISAEEKEAFAQSLTRTWPPGRRMARPVLEAVKSSPAVPPETRHAAVATRNGAGNGKGTGKGKAKVSPEPRFPFMDTMAGGAGLDLGVAAVPEANAQADRFEIVRRAFIQWCFEEFQIPKAKTSQNWNRWISAKCGFTLEAVEAAVELTKRRAAVAELSRLDNPLTYTENFLRKPEVMREAQRMEEDMSSNVVRGPETWRRAHPLRAGSTKLVTSAEEMGVTPGMAEIQLRNAALSEALAF